LTNVLQTFRGWRDVGWGGILEWELVVVNIVSYRNRRRYSGRAGWQPARVEMHNWQVFFLSLSFVVVNSYWLDIVCVILVVTFSINSQELFEVAATDFNSRNGTSFSGAHWQKYVVCPKYCHMLHNYSDQILFSFHMGLIMKILNIASKGRSTYTKFGMK